MFFAAVVVVVVVVVVVTVVVVDTAVAVVAVVVVTLNVNLFSHGFLSIPRRIMIAEVSSELNTLLSPQNSISHGKFRLNRRRER